MVTPSRPPPSYEQLSPLPTPCFKIFLENPLMTPTIPLVHVQNFAGVASRVPSGWRDSYGKTEILAGCVTKICLKCTKKLG